MAGVDAMVKQFPIYFFSSAFAAYGGYMAMWAANPNYSFRSYRRGGRLSDWRSYYGLRSD